MKLQTKLNTYHYRVMEFLIISKANDPNFPGITSGREISLTFPGKTRKDTSGNRGKYVKAIETLIQRKILTPVKPYVFTSQFKFLEYEYIAILVSDYKAAGKNYLKELLSSKKKTTEEFLMDFALKIPMLKHEINKETKKIGIEQTIANTINFFFKKK